ncbi:MAG: histone deacetylase [Parachlamydia sp.]|nr:histone deacetylase [Parachlamydia sp.]
MRRSLIVADAACKSHLTGFGHPERPERFDAICTALQSTGLLRQNNWRKARRAMEDELLLCHTLGYVRTVQHEVAQTGQLAMLSTGDTVICPASYDAALLAAGGVLTGIEAVLGSDAATSFVVSRPPGHHACSDRGMGFCLFNSIAIGARYAQLTAGLQRILIIDWDLHHGNGTQEIFDADPSVFYFSTHQAGIYPGTGAAQDWGSGEAIGTKMNFPIAPTTHAREEILAAVEGPLMRAMDDFKPELVLISCGFDAHSADPLGNLNLTDEDFGTLTRLALQIAERHAHSRVVSVLEGGYNLQALATASVAHVKVLQE